MQKKKHTWFSIFFFFCQFMASRLDGFEHVIQKKKKCGVSEIFSLCIVMRNLIFWVKLTRAHAMWSVERKRGERKKKKYFFFFGQKKKLFAIIFRPTKFTVCTYDQASCAMNVVFFYCVLLNEVYNQNIPDRNLYILQHWPKKNTSLWHRFFFFSSSSFYSH